MKKIFISIIAGLLLQDISAQTVKVLTNGTKTSIRGLSIPDDQTVWVSGSNGTVGRSVDSGNTWKWMIVKDFETADFRDIEAFDDMNALIMGIGSPAYILRTIDGGNNWKVVFSDSAKAMFLDAMEFWNDQSGIVIGDPVDNKFFIARTFDGGNIWKAIPPSYRPAADSGEACFASSGTNIRKLNSSEAVFITGGFSSRIFIRDKKISIPIIQGKETTGANSIAVKNSKTMIVTGGDFNTRDSTFRNCVITRDQGKTWTAPAVPPHGYRSCIEFLGKTHWVSCGLNGVDYSTDDGKTFSWISKESFHVCRKSKAGKAIYFAGGDGKVGRLVGFK